MTDDPVETLAEADQETRESARDRAALCAKDIAEVLERHHCRIMPRIDPALIEPVGVAGDRIQITATYWIAPLALDPESHD